MGILYLVSTPIGNLKDITLRALETLRESDIIACEDTRRSIVLLNHYEIKKPLVSYHKHNEKSRSEEILRYLEEGKKVALISDAGSPLISDPGAVIVKQAREEGHEIVVIPGASAVISAVSLAGIDTGFIFIGFLPEKKKSREEILLKYKAADLPLVFYSSPHNINGDRENILELYGDRECYIIKELTKIYESLTFGKLSDAALDNTKGEFVLIVMPGKFEEEMLNLSIKEHIVKVMLEQKVTKKEAVKVVAAVRKENRNTVYQESLDIKE